MLADLEFSVDVKNEGVKIKKAKNSIDTFLQLLEEWKLKLPWGDLIGSGISSQEGTGSFHQKYGFLEDVLDDIKKANTDERREEILQKVLILLS